LNILLVEDDLELCKTLYQGFLEEGYKLSYVNSIKEAQSTLLDNNFSVIILDKYLPDGDGFALCRYIRDIEDATPILFLSSKAEVHDRVEGLNSGADDYLAKPFHFIELIARVRTLTKRKQKVATHILKTNYFIINLMSREVKCNGIEIELRNNEFNILVLLTQNVNHVLSKTAIIETIWGLSDNFDVNTLNATIYNLRKKLAEAHCKDLIKTVRGIGYKLSED